MRCDPRYTRVVPSSILEIHMRFEPIYPRTFVVLLIGFIGVVYGLNRGVFVGSRSVLLGATCCPELDVVEKQCRYLFITGLSTVEAKNGEVPVSRLLAEMKQKLKVAGFSDEEISAWVQTEKVKGAKSLLRWRPDIDDGYCHIFAD